MVERKNSYNYDELIKCAKGELFEANSPRLPMPPMLMFDQVTEINDHGGAYNKGVVCTDMVVKKDLWFFNCHFIEDPVMPGCLGLDALWQMLGFYLGWTNSHGAGRALGVGKVKFSDMVLPDAKIIEYGIDIKKILKGKLVLGVADGWVKNKGKIIYTITDLRVGLFQKE